MGLLGTQYHIIRGLVETKALHINVPTQTNFSKPLICLSDAELILRNKEHIL